MRLAPRAMALLMTASLLLTGIASAAPKKDAPPADEKSPVSLTFNECALQVGVFPIDASDASPYLPEGFEPVPFLATGPGFGKGLPGPPTASATVQLTAFSCSLDDPRTSDDNEVAVVQAWLYVDPPNHLEDDGVEAYVVPVWTMSTSAALAKRFGKWGIATERGEVVVDVPTTLGPFEMGTITATREGLAVVMDSPLVEAIEDTKPEHLRLFTTSGGRLTGMIDMVEESHTHKLIGVADLTVEGEKAPFPLPAGPGVALHVVPGYSMTWTYSRF